MSFHKNVINSDLFQKLMRAQYPEDLKREEKKKLLEQASCYYVHPGELQDNILVSHANYAHPVLSSGKHSNGYMNLAVLPPKLLFEAMRQMANMIKREIDLERCADGSIYVCGPAQGAVVPGVILAHYLGDNVVPIYAEKHKQLDGLMTLDRFSIPGEDEIFLIMLEDTMTTGKSTLKALDSITRKYPGRKITVLCLCLIVDRRIESHVISEWPVFSWLDYRENAFKTYDQGNCPYCNGSSFAELLPKSNWGEQFANSSLSNLSVS
ncbi:MAG: hypothetical protein ABH967_00250 [Patescibacteria group bacterium]